MSGGPASSRRARLAVAGLLALLIGACQSAPPAGPRPGEGRFVLYLNGAPSTPLQVTFQLVSVDALLEGGGRAPVRTTPLAMDSLELVNRQILLAETFLPAGRYRGLALAVAGARAREEGRWHDLAAPAEPVAVEVPFEIRAGQVTARFMTWDVGRSVEGDAAFRPSMGLEGSERGSRRVLAYVTNEGSDTVSAIDRYTDRVISVLGVGRGPRGIAISPDTARAFVVNAGSQTLSIIDVPNDRVFHTTNLEGGSGPSDIAISADGRVLYVTNTALNSLSVIDAQSFQTRRVIAVGIRPTAVVAVPSRAVVVVANEGANTLSVVDTAREAVIATIPVDFQPARFGMDPAGTSLFVPHLGSPRLTVVSLSSLRPVRSVTVGVASAAAVDSELQPARVFVARPREGRVALYDTAVGAELGSAVVGDDPRALVSDPDREKLYAVNRASGTVTAIDRFSRRALATIAVGQRPYTMAIVP